MKKGMLRVALTAVALAAAPAGAQEEAECRCVDADGNQIERCTCFRMPDVEGLLARLEVERSRPRLGISLDPGQSASRDAEGVLVRDVMEGGPADEAGLREGDVITRLDGVSLTESTGTEAERDFDLDGSVPVQRLMALIREIEPGADVEVEYLRDGQRRTTTLEAADLSNRWGQAMTVVAPRWDADEFRDQMRVLADAPVMGWRSGEPHAFEFRTRKAPGSEGFRFYAPGGDAFVWSGGRHRDGLELIELNPRLGAYFGTEEGVLVADADPDGSLGLLAGDVVTAIGGRSVSTPDRFRRILSSYGEDEDIEFDVVRDGDRRTVTGRRSRGTPGAAGG